MVSSLGTFLIHYTVSLYPLAFSLQTFSGWERRPQQDDALSFLPNFWKTLIASHKMLISSNKSFLIRPFFVNMLQKYFGTGSAVAIRLMMAEWYPVIRTHSVQFMANARQKRPSHLNRATVLYCLFPFDPIIRKAFFQHSQIENSIAYQYPS